jgi:3-hydroxyacyl-CoA dehydrogenase
MCRINAPDGHGRFETDRRCCENAGATLHDMGDGVGCLEFHTKMNALDDDIMNMAAKR